MSDHLNGDTSIKPVLEGGNRLPETEVIKLGMDICSELDMSEREGIVHGNISPENVFVYENGMYILGAGDVAFDALFDIRALGMLMYGFLGGVEDDSEDIFDDVVFGVSGELAIIIKKILFGHGEDIYKSVSDIKRDLMTIYAKKCFGGVDVSMSEHAPASLDEMSAFRRDVRRMKENPNSFADSSKDDLEATLIADAVDGVDDTEDTFIFAEDDGMGDDGDAYRAAIEAGASVTAAAKILHGQRKNKKIKPYTEVDVTYVSDKKKGLIAAFAVAAVCILAIIIAIPVAFHALGNSVDTDTTDNPKDTSNITVAGILIESLPNKLSYAVGEIVETDGLVLEIIYESGVRKSVAGGYTVYPNTITESGEQEITILYGDFSIAYTIEAHSDEVESITILSLPEFTEYELGQEIDLSGIKIEVFYADGLTDELLSGFVCTPKTAQAVGEQEITVSYKGKEAIFKITVKEPSLERIEIRSTPTKVKYEVGESLYLKGFSLSAYYTDGTKKTVTNGYTCTPTVFSKVGNQKVSVQYGEQTAEFYVAVVEVVDIEISALPKKTSYAVGEALLTDGISLVVKYSDGSEKTVKDGVECTPTVFNKAGSQKVMAVYKGKSVEFEVTVVDIEGIKIATLPKKTEYLIGETLDTSGLSVLVKYADGTEKTVSEGFECTPTVFDKAGEQKVKVTYGEKSTEFVVTVQTTVASLEIVTLPKKMTYSVGETLDTRGLLILVKYSDGSIKNVSEDFEYAPASFDKVGKQKVSIIFGGKNVEFEVSVNDSVLASGDCGMDAQWVLRGYVLTISGSGIMDDYKEHGAPWEAYRDRINEVVIEEGILSVGKYAFAHTSVQRVTVGESVRNIEDGAFYNCTKLVDISVSDSNVSYADDKGVLYNKAKTKLILYPAGKKETSFAVSATLRDVDAKAFVGAKNLQNFILGDSKTELEVKDGVLYTKNFNALICYPAGKTQSSFSVPEGVGVIRENAFAGNANLVEIVLPSSLYRIDANAFGSTKKLTKVRYFGNEKAFAKIEINGGNSSITKAEIIFEATE